MRKIAMSYLTAPVADPLEALNIAASAGYDGIGLRLRDPLDGALSPLVTDPVLCDRFLAQLESSKLVVTEIEAWMLRDTPDSPTDPRVFETAKRLGRPGLIAVADLAGTVSLPRLAEAFASLCRDAASYGLTVGFEPIAHRAGGQLEDALAIAAAGKEWGATLVLDALHIHRMEIGSLALAQLDPALVPIFHVCDAPELPVTQAEAIDHSAFNRWLPGEGRLPLDSYLDALPRDLMISLEIPMTRLEDRLSPAERACIALEATRNWLARRGETGRATTVTDPHCTASEMPRLKPTRK